MVFDQPSDWVEPWRAVRGSSSAPPSDDVFNVLLSMPPEVLDEAAEASGDDPVRLRWWRSIAGDAARQHLAGLRMSQAAVYEALRDYGPMTDDELTVRMGRKKSEVSPRRVELMRLGLIHEIEKHETSAGRKSAAWGPVEADGVEEARRLALRKGPRRMHIDDYPLQHQIQFVRYLLLKDEVNDALIEDKTRSKETDRSRVRAREARLNRERDWREHNDRVRDAERDASPQLVFLKAIGQLRRAVDAVREIETVIAENIESQHRFGTADIGPEHWPDVRDELQSLIQAAAAADEHLVRFLEGGDDLIEVELIDDLDLELEAGLPDDEAAAT